MTPDPPRLLLRAVVPAVAVAAALAAPAVSRDVAPGTTRIVSPAPASDPAEPWITRVVPSAPRAAIRLRLATTAPGRRVTVEVAGTPVRRRPGARGRTWNLTRADGLRLGENRVEVITRAGPRVVDHDELLVVLARRRARDAAVSVRTDTRRAPAVVRFRPMPGLRVRGLWLNGRRADAALVRGAVRAPVAHLSGEHGLRRGENRLRAVVTAKGVSEVVTRSFRIDGRGVVATAGPDRAVQTGAPARLGAAAGRGGPGPGRWRIVSAPEGSRARITRPGARATTLVPDVPGDYVVERRLGPGPADVDTATVSAHPGWLVPVSSDGAQLRVGGTTYPDSVVEVALDRATLTRVAKAGAAPGTAVVVGMDDEGGLYAYVHGDRDATYRTGYGEGALVPTGGAPGAGGLYTFTFSDYVPFRTQTGDAGGGAKGITVGGVQLATPGRGDGGFQVVMFPGATDPSDIQPGAVFAQTFATNQADANAAIGEQEALENLLNGPTWNGQAVTQPIVLVQTYGRPYRDYDTIVANRYLGQGIENLGGSRSVLNRALAPDAPGAYSLVGLTADGRQPGERSAESSSVVYAGRKVNGDALDGGISGVLGRNADGLLRPVTSVTVGDYSQSLLPVLYQRPQPWPALTAGETAAARYVMWQAVSPNAPANPYATGDFRAAYQDEVDWAAALSNLNALAAQSGPGFTAADLTAARAQLKREFQAVSDLDGLLADLRRVFYVDGTQNMSALRTAAENVTRDLDPPAQSSVEVDVYDIISDIFYAAAAVAAVLPEADAAEQGLGLIGSVIGAGADIGGAAEDGLPPDNQDPVRRIDARVEDLGVQTQNAIAGQLAQLGVWRGVIVSDWGKLHQASVNAEPGGAWTWGDGRTAALTATLEDAGEARFYGELMPLGYVAYSLGDWPEKGPFGSPQSIECFLFDDQGLDDPRQAMFPSPDPVPSPYYEQWSYYGPVAGRPGNSFHPNWWFLSRPITPVGYRTTQQPADSLPPAALTATLFGADPERSQLGLFRPWFFERNFTPDTSFAGTILSNDVQVPICTGPGPQ